MQKYIWLTVIFVIAIAVTAIPLRSLEADETHVVVTSDNLTFDVSEIHAEAGHEVELTLDNSDGAGTHTFTIESIPASDVSPESEDEAYAVHIVAAGGEEVSVAFTPTEAGEYRFFCSIPTHAEAGMVGTLVVE